MSPKWISLKAKVALVIFVVSSVSFGVFFFSNYQNTIRRIHAHTAQLIAQDHRSHATHIINTLSSMQRDSEAIVGFPPIAGIMRSLNTVDGIDPLDGSNITEWRHRLETLFASMIGSRDYSQIRLILPQDNWTEYARVNRDGNSIHTTQWTELQVKGGEPYILQLKSNPSSVFEFSNVTRNREHKAVSGLPTIRSIRTIFSEDGAIAGAIVINARVSELLTVQQVTSQFSDTFYVIQNVAMLDGSLDDGDYRFSVRTAGEVSTQLVGQVFDLPEQKLVTLEVGQGIFITQVQLASLSTPFKIRIATKIDMSTLFAAAQAELRRSLANATLLTLFATLTGMLFTSKLLEPLRNLVNDIQGRTSLLLPLHAHFQGKDEISLIGQSFASITNDLIRETQRLDMVLTNVAEGIVNLKMDGTIEDLNPAAEKIFNLDGGSSIGKNLMQILGLCDKYEEIKNRTTSTVEGAPETNIELATRLNSGKIVHLQVVFKYAHRDEGGRMISLIRDISEQVKAREQTNALISALKKSNAELDQFAYVASHDLKAPLRVISNAVSWLEEDLAPHLTEDTRESMNLLQSRANRMERLLNDLLQHSRIGRVAEPDITISGREMALDLLQLLEIPAGITVSFSDGFVSAIFKKLPLETVMVNLIGNGIKHHDKTRGSIEVDLKDLGAFVEITIQDDGPGIEPKYHEKIFEVFQTLKSRDQLESSGMGLAFVKKYIDFVGGEIFVISDGENGTTFRLLWPREVSHHTQAA